MKSVKVFLNDRSTLPTLLVKLEFSLYIQGHFPMPEMFIHCSEVLKFPTVSHSDQKSHRKLLLLYWG